VLEARIETAANTSWWRALNPPIYLISVLPGAGLWLLLSGRGVAPSVLWSSVLGVVLLQHTVNVFNDAKDWQLGADVEKYDSWVRVHGEQPGVARLHALISLVAAGLLGVSVLLVNDRLWNAWLLLSCLDCSTTSANSPCPTHPPVSG
jgi:1,4-dihydroxy-2-naphthoate octaprenyltransferase